MCKIFLTTRASRKLRKLYGVTQNHKMWTRNSHSQHGTSVFFSAIDISAVIISTSSIIIMLLRTKSVEAAKPRGFVKTEIAKKKKKTAWFVHRRLMRWRNQTRKEGALTIRKNAWATWYQKKKLLFTRISTSRIIVDSRRESASII